MIKSFQPHVHKPCPTCNGPVYGRKDKRFCTQKCKNAHHRTVRNYLKPRTDESQRKIRRNLTLLEGIMGKKSNGMAIHRDDLIKRGFDMHCCTRSVIFKRKPVYELGGYQYTILQNGYIIVRRMIELNDYLPGFYERHEIDFPCCEETNELFKPGQIISEFCRWHE